MGYTTDFNGTFSLNKPLAPEHAAYLRAFSTTRRVRRNPAIAETMPDPVRVAAGLPIGPEGCFFVGGTGHMGQDNDASTIDGNTAPGQIGYSSSIPWTERRVMDKARVAKGEAQPGLWCQWVPTVNGDGIEWDGGEKFYDYEAWLTYIIAKFLAPWGYILNGKVTFQGEDSDDRGALYCENNVVTKRMDTIVPA